MTIAALCLTIQNGDSDLGYVAFDSFVAGRATGGLRMLPDVSPAELALLAHSMTLKYGFLGLPQGGAKAGIRFDPEAPLATRRERLAQFARALGPLLTRGVYLPNADMGTDENDIRSLLGSVGLRPSRPDCLRTDSSYYTALTVRAAAVSAARHIGLPLAGARVAVEGYGHVGGHVARLLAELGARIVALSNRVGAIYAPDGLDLALASQLVRTGGSAALQNYPGAQRLSPQAMLELELDLLAPCARHHSLRADNSERVRARLVCGGANNYATPPAEQALAARGVLVMPDFVANSGGVLGGTMEFAGLRRGQIETFIATHLADEIEALLRAAEEGRSLRALAEECALERGERARQNIERHTPMAMLAKWGLQLYRRGWLPSRLIALAAPRYIAKCLR